MEGAIWSQKGSPGSFERSQFTSRKRNMKEKNNMQLQKHVANQQNPLLLPQQSPQGQGGSQDTHIYRTQFLMDAQGKTMKIEAANTEAVNSQVRKSTALPNIKQKSSQKVSSMSPIDLRNNLFKIKPSQRRSNNLRVIEEEQKDY